MKEHTSLDQGVTIPSPSGEVKGEGFPNTTETTQQQTEKIDTNSQDIIEKNNNLEKSSKELEDGLKASSDLYKNETFSRLMKDYNKNFKKAIEESAAEVFAPMIKITQQQEDELNANLSEQPPNFESLVTDNNLNSG